MEIWGFVCQQSSIYVEHTASRV